MNKKFIRGRLKILDNRELWTSKIPGPLKFVLICGVRFESGPTCERKLWDQVNWVVILSWD